MKKHKILFVDDEHNILKSLKRLFFDEDYDIYTANNGRKALALMDKHTFPLIVSDYRMPELNGVEFLKLAKKKAPETLRVILTGFADVNVATAAINEGEIYKFIDKPWEDENLILQVHKAIEHYEVLQEKKKLLIRIKEQNVILQELNINLEKKVERRTEELHFKVKELEGRDKLLQNILSINSFEENLQLVIEVIHDVLNFDKIIIYVRELEGKKLFPEIGFAFVNDHKCILKNESEKMSSFPASEFENEDKVSAKTREIAELFSEYAYCIPINMGQTCLGLIIVENSVRSEAITQKQVKSLSSFANIAKLVINEHFVTAKMPEWEEKINNMLDEF